MQGKSLTSGIIIIGNEILSGRTLDTNSNYIAKELTKLGIELREIRVISDNEAQIAETVKFFSKNFDYVFTTGGIGPTHDDITSESIAKAFNREWKLNEEARKIMAEYYTQQGEELTEARLRMAKIPEGSKLIKNSITSAPGFIIENVYVMAGIPNVMYSMFEEIKPYLQRGKAIYSEQLTVNIPESRIADDLRKLQEAHPEVDIGSYPFNKDGKWGAELVLRSRDQSTLSKVIRELKELVKGE